jgi:hypothetical protein
MKITIEVDDKELSDLLTNAFAAALGGQKPEPPKEVKIDRGKLIGLINGFIKDADSPSIGQQNRQIIKSIFDEMGVTKVPELEDNQIGEAYRRIEEKCIG